MKKGGKRSFRIFPFVLLVSYIVLFLVFSINPYDRMAWFADNILIVIIVLILVMTYKKFQFSNTSYLMMSFLIFINTIGAFYTFSRVPFFVEIANLFGLTRNYYDRLGHFAFGLWTYPVFELVYRKKLIENKIICFLFSIFSVLAIGSLYEVIEWVAVLISPESGLIYLAAQGDFFDTPKDLLLNFIGALFGVLVFWLKVLKK